MMSRRFRVVTNGYVFIVQWRWRWWPFWRTLRGADYALVPYARPQVSGGAKTFPDLETAQREVAFLRDVYDRYLRGPWRVPEKEIPDALDCPGREVAHEEGVDGREASAVGSRGEQGPAGGGE